MDLRITTSETILVFCTFANTGYCMFFFYKKKSYVIMGQALLPDFFFGKFSTNSLFFSSYFFR